VVDSANLIEEWRNAKTHRKPTLDRTAKIA
jgi:hypothetical protein